MTTDLKLTGPLGGSDDQNNGNQSTLAAVLNLIQAVNGLQKVLASALPGGNAIAATAGAATGTYLTVTIAGVPYKIALLAN